MNGDYLMIHYGELSTKGDNRKLFVNQLARNIRHALKSFPTLTVAASRDHAYVELHEEDADAVIARLQDVSGIHSISRVFKSGKDLESLQKFALELLNGEQGKTFKVNVKRADKTYPLDSYHLACALAIIFSTIRPLRWTSITPILIWTSMSGKKPLIFLATTTSGPAAILWG